MRLSFSRIVVLLVCLYTANVVFRYAILPPLFMTSVSTNGLPRERKDISEVQHHSKDSEDHKQSHHFPKTQWKRNDVGKPKKMSWKRTRSHVVGINTPDDVLLMKRPNYLKNYQNPCWNEGSIGNTVLKCLPYFKLLGVDKCGTTDLWYRLTKHPDIVRPKAVMGKETHWWSWRRFGFDIWVRNRPIRHFDWYLSHFDDPASKIRNHIVTRNGTSFHKLVTGEGSPTEFWDFTGWNLIPQNANKSSSNAFLTPHCLHHLTPGIKAIVIFRNPTNRAYSDYLFLDQFRPITNLSAARFHRDVVSSIQMFEDCLDVHSSQQHCLYDKDLHIKMPVRLIPGLYDLFLSKWLDVFPPSQILVMRNEDYSANIKKHLEKVFQFLQLSTLNDEEMSRISKLPRVFEKSARAKSVGPMLAATRALLDNFYKPYNQKLSERMKNSNYLWKM